MMPSHALFARDTVAAAIAGILALSEAAQVYLGMSLQGAPVSWLDASRATLPSWAVLLVLVLILFRVLDRLDRMPPARRLTILSFCAPLFSGVHLTGAALLATRIHTDSPPFVPLLTRLFTFYFVTGLLAYAAIVTIHDRLARSRARQAAELAAAHHRADRAVARADALEGRLRPDFLFNTLNAVAGLVARGDRTPAVEVVTALGHLMRSDIAAAPGEPAAVEAELARVESYLSIQSLRFPGRARPRSLPALPPGCSVRVPSGALPALVEAVVDAGLAAGTPFQVGLEAVHGGGELRLGVRSSGPPPDPLRLDHLRRALHHGADGPRLDETPGGVTLVVPVPPLPAHSRAPGPEGATA